MNKYTLAREVNKILHSSKSPLALSTICRKKELKAITKYNERICNACLQLVDLGVARVSANGGYEGLTNMLRVGRLAETRSRQRKYMCYL